MLVICNGMMRSGSTIQYNLARTLVARLDRGAGEGYLAEDEFSALEARLDGWANDEVLHVVKMHAIHPRAAEMSAGGRARICYVYRDIRDVAASAKRIWGYRGPKLLQSLEKAIESYDQLSAIPNVLFQRYEELVGDLPRAAVELAQFLGLEAPRNVVGSVADECSIEHAKAISGGMKSASSPLWKRLAQRLRLTQAKVYHPDTLLHPDHISNTNGSSGIWRQLLDREEREAIAGRYTEWLEKHGYAA